MGYQDTKSLGSSKIAPFIPGENYSDRHFRRLQENLKRITAVSEFCSENGWLLKIHNDGHHWAFTKGKDVIDWWPSSAKLVTNKNFKRGIHCHDYEKLIGYIKKFDATRVNPDSHRPISR